MAASTVLWVDAGPFRAHLRHVMGVGRLSATEVAVLAGVSPRLADSLLTGRAGRPVRRISPQSARALLHVDAAGVRRLRERQVPAEESRRRLRGLLRRRPGLPDLADELGVTAAELATLSDPSTGWCSALLALRLLTAARAAPTAASLVPDPLPTGWAEVAA